MEKRKLHIIMPVKDSIETTREAIGALYASVNKDWQMTVYNDFSTEDNTLALQNMSSRHGFRLWNWQEHTDTPSPNYRLTLIHAQEEALKENADLLIIESDVLVNTDTIDLLLAELKTDSIGMVASVTHDRTDKVNFPYEYARRYKADCSTKKRLSFCCTILSRELLQRIDFHELNAEKDWFDVYISHESCNIGLTNRLLLSAPVTHLPHSSRPWKQLKYTNPILYYWRKLTQKKDKI